VRYRRLGKTELEVSEVGFGVWTLASDWWGRVDDPQALLHAALDAGINFVDTAPVYGEDGRGESLLADVLATGRDEIVLTTKCGYDLEAPRPASQRERPQDWRPEAVRRQLEASLRRLGTEHIDLYQLHNVRMDAVEADDLWAELEAFRSEGKVRELGVALGPAIGWIAEGLLALRERPIATLQTVFNILEQEPGLTFAAEPAVQDGAVSMISRVPHASDVLLGTVDPDTRFAKGDHRAHRNHDNMLDNLEKTETVSFLWAPETGRTIGQAAIAGILANPAFATVLPTVTTVEELHEFAGASELPLTADERRALDDLWSRNFDHEDRFVMPMKSSR